jgi:hypothetical protein
MVGENDGSSAVFSSDGPSYPPRVDGRDAVDEHLISVLGTRVKVRFRRLPNVDRPFTSRCRVPHVERSARDKFARRWSIRMSSTACRTSGAAVLFDANSGMPVVPRLQQEPWQWVARPTKRGAVHRCSQDRPDGRSHSARVDRRRRCPHRPGATTSRSLPSARGTTRQCSTCERHLNMAGVV